MSVEQIALMVAVVVGLAFVVLLAGLFRRGQQRKARLGALGFEPLGGGEGADALGSAERALSLTADQRIEARSVLRRRGDGGPEVLLFDAFLMGRLPTERARGAVAVVGAAYGLPHAMFHPKQAGGGRLAEMANALVEGVVGKARFEVDDPALAERFVVSTLERSEAEGLRRLLASSAVRRALVDLDPVEVALGGDAVVLVPNRVTSSWDGREEALVTAALRLAEVLAGAAAG